MLFLSLIFCKQEDYCSSGAFQVAPASYYLPTFLKHPYHNTHHTLKYSKDMKADWYWRLYIYLFSLHCLQNYLLRINLGYPLLVVMTSFHWTLNRHNKCWKVYWNTSKHDLETKTFISFHVYWQMLTKIKIKKPYTVYFRIIQYMKIRAIIVSTSTPGYYNKDVYFCFWCVLDTTLCDKVCQRLAAGLWFSPVSSTKKTDRHDVSEILLKVVLNIINLPSI